MNGPPATIVFDLDGTLVDTAPDLAAAMNAVLHHFGRPAVDAEAVRHMVGHGARRMIELGLVMTGGGDGAMVEAGVPVFLDSYARNICVESRPWDGVEAALTALAGEGHSIALCTNKPKALTLSLLEALGWSQTFAAVLGGDSLPVRKPDPRHVIETIELAGGSVERAIFVGDSVVDVGAARAAGLPVVLTSFGYTDVPARDLSPDAVIDHFDALIPTLRAVGPHIFAQGDAPT
jgi:phosphoglycolate phosphatase